MKTDKKGEPLHLEEKPDPTAMTALLALARAFAPTLMNGLPRLIDKPLAGSTATAPDERVRTV